MRMIVLALAAWICGQAAVAQPAVTQRPLGQVLTAGLRPLSAHVQVIPDNSVGLVPNIGFIVGTRAVLVVDTGLGHANGAAVAEVAQRIAPGRKIFLVATHAHPEHDFGAGAFPAGSVLIRSVAQQADKLNDERIARQFADHMPAAAALLQGAAFRDADETFEQTLRLDLGGVTARLAVLGPAHTDGDIAIWVEEDRVLFSGDLGMQAQPYIGTPRATLASWRRALSYLSSLRPIVVAPSHGPLGDAGYLSGYAAYLDEIERRAQAARASGLAGGEATDAVWQAMKARYPDRMRLEAAVRMALAESPVAP